MGPMGEAQLAELACRQDGLVARHGRAGGLAALRSVLDAREAKGDPGESAGEDETAQLLVDAATCESTPSTAQFREYAPI